MKNIYIDNQVIVSVFSSGSIVREKLEITEMIAFLNNNFSTWYILSSVLLIMFFKVRGAVYFCVLKLFLFTLKRNLKNQHC